MWTEQTVETLRKLALEGRSAAWIAAALGAPSRSAVIGKANRIGIKLNGGLRSATRGDGTVTDASPPPAGPWGRTLSHGGDLRSTRKTPSDIAWGRVAARAQKRTPAVSQMKMRVDRRAYAKAEVGEMRRIGFADIGEVQCRWPIGDPLQDDFVYCGLQVARGHAYCAGHCRLAYQAPHG